MVTVEAAGINFQFWEPTDTAMATKGRVTFSYTVTAADLPATFTVTTILRQQSESRHASRAEQIRQES